MACYIHLSYGGYCTATVFNGIDSIFITACFHIAAQFRIITLKIENILKKSDPSIRFTAVENREIRHGLIDIMNDQIKLFELSDLLIESFTAIILMHFISVAFIIGIGSISVLMVYFNLSCRFWHHLEDLMFFLFYLIFQAPGSDKILYVAYIATVTIQSFAYAYSGHQICEHVEYLQTSLFQISYYRDILFLQSLDICKAIYYSDWHHLDRYNQQMIRLIILRGQKAKLVQVPFFEVTLTAYTKVLIIFISFSMYFIINILFQF